MEIAINETWLLDFLSLAEHLNFSRAADSRNVTQPAFGRRIRSLEEWCGQPLIDRSSHRLALTEAGELMQVAAEDLLRRQYRLLQDLGALETQSNKLIFASTQALSFTFFPDWFNRFSSGAAVHLLADNMGACELLMEEGRAQFLLCHTHPELKLNLPQNHYRILPLASDTMVPVSRCSESGEPSFELQGTDIPYLCFDERSGLGRILAAGLSQSIRSLNLRPVFTSHVAMALKTMTLDGRGVAWLPRSLVSDEIEKGLLVPIGGPDWQIEVAISLIRPKARLSEKAEQFWSLLKG